MKNRILQYACYSIMLFIATVLLAGCKKYNDWNADPSHKRLFSPTQLTTEVSGVSVLVGWAAVVGANKYVVEISKDSLAFGNVIATIETAGEKLVSGSPKFYLRISTGLDARTRYSVRIKAVDEAIPGSKWTTATFITETEQIMYNVSIEDIEPRAVTLKWLTPNQVTHFMINGNRYDISTAEAAAGAKQITGLTPKTSYNAILYNNTAIRGTQTFSTKADIPSGSNVVEVAANADFAAMLAGPVTPGTIFVLLQGAVYKADELITLPNNASFTIWGEDGPQKPVLAFNGINLPSGAGTIKFENLDITGYQDVTSGTKRNYVFNQSAASNTDAVVFENCIIRNFVNSPFRTQGNNGIYIGSLTFNKCIVYDIGDNGSNGSYAFIHHGVGAGTGSINNITIINSTLYRIGYGIIVSSNTPSQNVVIENCTFNNVVGNARYFIDYNAQVVSSSFKFNNNIIGKTLSPAASARGIRSGSTALLQVNNSYQASDAVFAANTIAGINVYTNVSSNLFTNPDNGDFSIKDNSFEGRNLAGDPRWR